MKADTHGEQQPWSEASIQGDFYFHNGPAEAYAPAPVATPSAPAEIRTASLSTQPSANPPAQAAPQPDASDAASPHFGFAWAQKVQTTATRVGSAQYSPLPANGDVTVYKTPDEVKGQFEVLATLSHSDPCKFHTCTLNDAIAPLSVKAREVGANAIIIDKSQTVKTSLMSTGISVSARAVRLQ